MTSEALNAEQPTQPDAEASSSVPYVVAYILGLAGVFLILWAFAYDVSAGGYGLGSDVANLDKMERRMMLLQSGLASVLGCLVTVGFAQVVKAIKSSR